MAKAKVKKVEELSPVEINRDITKVSNVIKKTQNPRMRDVITAGKEVEIEGRTGHINRIQDNMIYIEMLDNPGKIEQFQIKKALKSYKTKKAKNVLVNTDGLAGPANGSVAKEPKVSKGLVGLKMEKFTEEEVNEFHKDGSGGPEHFQAHTGNQFEKRLTDLEKTVSALMKAFDVLEKDLYKTMYPKK